MKKVLSIIVILCMLQTANAFATENSIDSAIDNLWLDPTTDSEVIENIREENNKKMQEDIDLYLIAPGTYRQKIGISADDEIMKAQVQKTYEVYSENILKIYYLTDNSYSEQYSESKCLDYLISEDYYLYMEGYDYNVNDYNGVETIKYRPFRYCADGSSDNYTQFSKDKCYSGGLGEDGYNFLKDADKVKNILVQNNISNVEEMKVVIIGSNSTCLYIKCDIDEYLIRVYMDTYRDVEQDKVFDWVDKLELFKLYSAKDFFNTVSTEVNEMNAIKPTYDNEAMALQNDGLLQGNENGLDLLKPLSRIEATTVLVRALGLENAETSAESYFIDIPSDNWGARYANIAADAGIAAGVGNDMFAPDENMTSSQFATLILRNMGENPDWQTAINVFVERGLITQEQANNMNFFTRGDMAKLIYEAKEHNMF